MKDSIRIIEEYRGFATLHWNASREGNYKKANKNYAKLTKIYKMFLNSQELQKEALPKLLNLAFDST